MVEVEEPDVFKATVSAAMQPILEAWSGVKLEHTSLYGVRRYTKGSSLMLHVDVLQTHVVSAILQVIGWAKKEGILVKVGFRGLFRTVNLLSDALTESIRYYH